MKAYWVSVSFISFIVGGCCGHLCNAQEFDRRKQPPVTIENTSAVEDPEVRTTPQETPADVIIPVADPISTPPEVTFSTVVSNTVDKPRLPRALLLHGQGCAPCIRMERELGDLVGDNTAPIEIVKTWEKNQLESLGVTPSMMFHGTPLLIVLDKDGKIHSLTSAGFGCFLSGFHNRQEVINYLSLPEHGVDLTPRSPSSQVVATVAKAEGSAFDFAAVVAAHLMRSSGQEAEDSPIVVGSLFEFDIEVDASWRKLASKILSGQKIEFPAAGLSVDWTGPERSFSLLKNGFRITPPVQMTVQKWKIKHTAGLNGVAYSDDFSSVEMDLSGAPDITINLVSKAVD